MTKVPLVLFAFNRPDKLRQVLSAIKSQTVKPETIIAIVDGPRHHGDDCLIRACCRDLAGQVDEVIERPTNYGCAANIMHGTGQIAAHYERFVVLEDDTLPARTWYEAMCFLLDYYQNDLAIGAVGAFPSVLNGSLPFYPYDVILSPRFSCWGWGSWSSKWLEIYSDWINYCLGRLSWDPAALPSHAGPDISNMIQGYQRGTLWDGVVAGSFLHRDWLQAIPRYYLVHNIGVDLHIENTKIRFMLTNNPIEERLPASFPPIGRSEEVNAAIRAYVMAMG